jgi:hypothetical protein
MLLYSTYDGVATDLKEPNRIGYIFQGSILQNSFTKQISAAMLVSG